MGLIFNMLASILIIKFGEKLMLSLGTAIYTILITNTLVLKSKRNNLKVIHVNLLNSWYMSKCSVRNEGRDNED